MGTLWAASGSIARNNSDVRAAGALAYFYAGGTTTPTTVYSDGTESTAITSPVTADSNGRWPSVFIPFQTSYDVKVTTSGGTQLYYYTLIPNADPVDAAAGVATTSTQLFQTGMCTYTFTDAAQSGFARLNGRTLGNAASGATERANADTSDLFVHLWNNLADTLAAVSTGRGGSAAADYSANKTITLPDLRGAIPMGLDTMGNSAASLLTGVTFSAGSSSTAGSKGGENTHTLVTAELAAHTHGPGTYTADSQGAHTHTGTTDSGGAHTHTTTTGLDNGSPGNAAYTGNTGNSATTSSDGAHTHTFTSGSFGAHTHTVTGGVSASTGSGTAHNVVSKCVLVSWHIKL